MYASLSHLFTFRQYWDFELWALHFLGKHSTTLAMPPTLFHLSTEGGVHTLYFLFCFVRQGFAIV
jgi:hypothetical protein